MAGVLSRAAGRLRCLTHCPTITLLRLPSAFPTGPKDSLVPRLVHTDVPVSRVNTDVPFSREEVKQLVRETVAAANAMRPAPPPTIARLTSADVAAFRDEIRLAVKEGVKEEMKTTTTAFFDRYERLTTRVVNLEEVSATRHSDAMSTYIKSEQRVAKISFRIGITMIGLAAASQYQGQIGNILLHVFGVDPSAPSAEEIAATVRQQIEAAKTEMNSDIPYQVKVAVAEHFEEEEEKKKKKKSSSWGGR